MLTLLGLTPGYPLIDFNNTPAQSPALQYNAAAQTFDVTTTPTAILPTAASPPTFINTPSDLEIHIKVANPSGNLIGGNGAAFPVGTDFYMSGAFTYNGVSYSGTLLTGSVLQFGYQANAGTGEFDFRFQTTGGELTTLAPIGGSPLYSTNSDTYLFISSENSTFTGSFASNFQGGAKGFLGPVNPLPVSIYGYKSSVATPTGTPSPANGLANWTFYLYSGPTDIGSPIAVATTNTSGQYSFTTTNLLPVVTTLSPGTYTVQEVQQTGWTQTNNLNGATVTLTSGQVAVAYSTELGTLPPLGTVQSQLAFANFHPTQIVIGMDKSPLTPKTASVVNPISGTTTLVDHAVQQHVPGRRPRGNRRSQRQWIRRHRNRAGPHRRPVINVYDQFGNLLTSFNAYPVVGQRRG